VISASASEAIDGGPRACRGRVGAGAGARARVCPLDVLLAEGSSVLDEVVPAVVDPHSSELGSVPQAASARPSRMPAKPPVGEGPSRSVVP
jgi:hypothetical protein